MNQSNVNYDNFLLFDVPVEKIHGDAFKKARSKYFFMVYPCINNKYNYVISTNCMKIPKKYRRNKRMLKRYNFYCQISFDIVNSKVDDESVLDLFLDCFYDLQKQYPNRFNAPSKNNKYIGAHKSKKNNQRESSESVFLAVVGKNHDNPDVLAYELLFELYPSNKLTFKENSNVVLDSIGDYINEIEKYIIIDNVSIKCLSDKDFDDEI